MLVREEARRLLPVIPRFRQHIMRIGIGGAFLVVVIFLLIRIPQCMRQKELISAIKSDDVARAREILQRPVELNVSDTEGWTALHHAASEGNSNLVAMLLQKGANANIRESNTRATPLHFAAAEGKSDIVELLVENGASVEARGFGCAGCSGTPLEEAVQGGHPETVDVLIRLGAKINKRYYNGNTLLHRLAEGRMGQRAREKGAELVEVLIEGGADIDVKNNWGDTALDVAKEMKAGDIERVLEKYRAKQKDVPK